VSGPFSTQDLTPPGRLFNWPSDLNKIDQAGVTNDTTVRALYHRDCNFDLNRVSEWKHIEDDGSHSCEVEYDGNKYRVIAAGKVSKMVTSIHYVGRVPGGMPSDASSEHPIWGSW
jgi:hypothetical protein